MARRGRAKANRPVILNLEAIVYLQDSPPKTEGPVFFEGFLLYTLVSAAKETKGRQWTALSGHCLPF